MTKPKTFEQRQKIVSETLYQIEKMGLKYELATRVLTTMLDNYLKNGTTYVNKELFFTSSPRKYVVNLRNMRSIQDTIIIKTINPDDEVEEESTN